MSKDNYQQGWVPRSKVSEIIAESRKFFESATEGTYAMIIVALIVLCGTAISLTAIALAYSGDETYTHKVIVPKDNIELLESYQRDGYNIDWIYNDEYPWLRLKKEYRVEREELPTIIEDERERLEAVERYKGRQLDE